MSGNMSQYLIKHKYQHKKHGSTKKFLVEKVVFCMSDLKNEKGKIYEVCQVGKQTKMSYKMFQHITRVSELPLMEFVRLRQGITIEGMVDGQVRGPPNIEQPTVVQNKKLKKINDYGIIFPIGVPSHICGIFTIQKHDIIFGEAEISVPLSVLNFSYKLYVRKHVPDIVPHNFPHFDKSDLAAGENILDVPLMYEHVRNHPPI